MRYNLVVIGGGLSGVAAAGTATAVALKSEKNLHTIDVSALQKKLTDNGAVL